MFVLLCETFCVRKSEVEWLATAGWVLFWGFFLPFVIWLFQSICPDFKEVNFQVQMPRGWETKKQWYLPLWQAHIASIVCRVLAPRGCAKTTMNPASSLFTRSWQSPWGHETVKSLWKACDCCFDTQYSGRSRKWRAEKRKKTEPELNLLGLGKRIGRERRKEAKEMGYLFLESTQGSHWKHITQKENVCHKGMFLKLGFLTLIMGPWVSCRSLWLLWSGIGTFFNMWLSWGESLKPSFDSERNLQPKKINDYSILANTLPTHLQKYTSLNLCFQMRRYLGGI